MTVVCSLAALLLLSLAVHEAGHYAAARLLGYPASLVLFRRGVGVKWGSDTIVSPRSHRLAVTLAGPAASTAGGIGLMLAGQPWGAFVIYVGAVQMLPLPSSDGHVAWKIMRGTL